MPVTPEEPVVPVQPPVQDTAQPPKEKFPVALVCVLGGVVVAALLIALNFAVVKNAAFRLFLSSDDYAKFFIPENEPECRFRSVAAVYLFNAGSCLRHSLT